MNNEILLRKEERNIRSNFWNHKYRFHDSLLTIEKTHDLCSCLHLKPVAFDLCSKSRNGINTLARAEQNIRGPGSCNKESGDG